MAQCENLNPSKIPVPSAIVREFTPIEEAERIVDAMPQKPAIKLGLGKAFYSPSGDFVGMPTPQEFVNDEEYYSVLFHELTHHSNRSAQRTMASGCGLSFRPAR
jgi:antirestriction protein ArdC